MKLIFVTAIPGDFVQRSSLGTKLDNDFDASLLNNKYANELFPGN